MELSHPLLAVFDEFLFNEILADRFFLHHPVYSKEENMNDKPTIAIESKVQPLKTSKPAGIEPREFAVGAATLSSELRGTRLETIRFNSKFLLFNGMELSERRLT